MSNDEKTATAAAARAAAAAVGGAPQVDPHRAAQELPPGSVGPVEARSPLFAHITSSQQADMKHAGVLTCVKIRLETAATNEPDLRSKAQALEAQRVPVPATFAAFIADAGEKLAVAQATFTAKLTNANDEIAVAARQGDALREWAARRSDNLLNGRPPPAKHELTHTYNEYHPRPPTDLPSSPETEAIQVPLTLLAHKLKTAREIAARRLDYISDLEMRGGTPADSHLFARDTALAAVGHAETNVCQILIEANKARLPEEADADPDAAMMAKRKIAWVMGAPPPTGLTPPPSPPPSPPAYALANHYAVLTDKMLGDCEVDPEEYKLDTSPTPVEADPDAPATIPEPDPDATPTPATKTRRSEREPTPEKEPVPRPRGKKIRTAAYEPGTTDAMTDRSHVHHDAVRERALVHEAEARLAMNAEQTAALAEMEAPPDTTTQDTAAGMAAARALTENAQENQQPTASPIGMATVAEDSSKAPQLSTAQFAALPKSTRLSIAANRKFFHLLSPRLNGTTDPPPCPKCDHDDCYLMKHSDGRLAPFNAQLIGAGCKQRTAPSVCMAAWFAQGTLDAILGTATSRVAGGNTRPQTTTPPQEMTQEQARANEQEQAILKVEAAIARLTAEIRDMAEDARRLDEAYYQQKAELTNAAESRSAGVAAATANLAEIRAARAAGTTPTLLPVPKSYTPTVPPTHMTHRERALATAERQPEYDLGIDAAPLSDHPPAPRAYAVPPGFPTLQDAAAMPAPPKTAPHSRLAARQAEAANSSYAMALARTTVPQGARVSVRTRPSRAEVSMLHVDHILITNFDHQPINITKAAFGHLLEEHTDVLHYTRMPFDGLELSVPRWQKQDVSLQLRQIGFILKPDYHPAESMVRRRKGESDMRAREREAYCATRAFEKVADAPRANPAVRAWFARAIEIVQGQCPTAFTNAGRNEWDDRLTREADERSKADDARAAKDGMPAPAPDAPPPPPPKGTGAAPVEGMPGQQLAKEVDKAGTLLAKEADGRSVRTGENMDESGEDPANEDEVKVMEKDQPAKKTTDEQSKTDTVVQTAREYALPGDK